MLATGATDIGSIKASLILETKQFREGTERAKKDLGEVAENAQKSSKSMKDLAESMKKAADTRDKIGKLAVGLDNVNARIDVQKTKLADLKRRYSETFDDVKKSKLNEQILSAEASLIRMIDTSDKTAKKINELEDSLGEASDSAEVARKGFGGLETALTAIGAGAALGGIVKTVKTLAGEAHALSMSLQGLAEVAKALGHDVGTVTGEAEKLAARGFMSVQEAADALKTTLSSGYSIEESINLINALADAAAYNREAHFEWGEAIVNATRGIKMMNSNLTDSAGITTNLSVMYDRYAQSIGTTAGKLTEAQKYQAAYNGMMAEAALFAGNADKALEGYAGTQSSFNKTIETARAELGEAYLPIIEEITEKLTGIIKETSVWASENKELIVGLTGGAAAALGLIAAITTLISVVYALRTAFIALNASIGPVGIAIAAIGVASAAMIGYTSAVNMASAAQRELNELLEKSPLQRTADEVQELRARMVDLTDSLRRMQELQREWDSLQERRATAKSAEEYRAFEERLHSVGKELREVTDRFKSFGLSQDEAVAKIAEINAAVEKSIPALLDMSKAEVDAAAAKRTHAEESKALRSEYEKLSAKTSRTKEETERLKTVVAELTNRYPSLKSQISDTGELMTVNKTILDELISAEGRAADAAYEAKRAELDRWKATAQAALDSAKIQVQALRTIAEASGQRTKADYQGKGLKGVLSFVGDYVTAGLTATAQDEYDKYIELLNEIDKEIAVLDGGSRNGKGGNTGAGNGDGDKGKGSGKTAPTAEQLAQEAYRAALTMMDKQRLLGELTEKQEAERLGRLAEQFKKYDDIWIDAESRRQRIVKQMAADEEHAAKERAKKTEEAARDRFQHSVDWIEQESRAMTLAGESEEAIAQMKLEAWSRVRSRYDKDSDYYKRADSELYRLRVDLIKKEEQAIIASQKQAKENANTVIKSIEAQKKAELDALDERRKAIKSFYDEQKDLIDDGERLRERTDLLAEIEKYRYATSEKGRQHLAELQERLRKMDLDDQRRALEEERDAELAALDKQQKDIESWYDELKTLLDDYNGDFIAIYQKTEDERFKAFTDTNANILTELEKFKTEYAAIMESLPTGGASASAIAQMAANAKAWHSAKAAGDTDAMRRAAEANQQLGASIGGTYRGGSWFGQDGLPLFHTGRDGATGRTFSLGDRLMPDEITAILRNDEYVFTPGQMRSLFEGIGGRGGNTYVEKIVGMEVNDAVLEDDIDIRALGRTGVDMATEMARRNFTGIGGSGQ